MKQAKKTGGLEALKTKARTLQAEVNRLGGVTIGDIRTQGLDVKRWFDNLRVKQHRLEGLRHRIAKREKRPTDEHQATYLRHLEAHRLTIENRLEALREQGQQQVDIIEKLATDIRQHREQLEFINQQITRLSAEVKR